MSDVPESNRQNRVILDMTADGTVTVDVKNIYAISELTREATVSKMETVQADGKRQITREVKFYNLDAVIALGCRVNSVGATHVRIWATNALREIIVKGFVLNDQMLLTYSGRISTAFARYLTGGDES